MWLRIKRLKTPISRCRWNRHGKQQWTHQTQGAVQCLDCAVSRVVRGCHFICSMSIDVSLRCCISLLPRMLYVNLCQSRMPVSLPVSVLAACITVCPCPLMLCVPRHVLAAGDYGSALALGAHGVAQDTEEGEKYLQIAAAGGDVASQRNYGMLLLQLNRAAEAAEQLSAASGT